VEFSSKIDEALKLAKDRKFKKRLLELARQNDWLARAEMMGVVFPDH
jgi:hypothetical protein